MIISKGSSENEIILEEEDELLKAIVSGNSFTFVETTYTEDFNGTAVTFDVSGSGKLKDGDLTFKVLEKSDEYGITATGDFSLVKTK